MITIPDGIVITAAVVVVQSAVVYKVPGMDFLLVELVLV